MKSYQEMTREELLEEKALLKAEYKKYQAKTLSLVERDYLETVKRLEDKMKK